MAANTGALASQIRPLPAMPTTRISTTPSA
jgi:hypothetical protein